MELRRRLLPHFVFHAIVWPLASILLGARMLKEQPLTGLLEFRAALAGVAAGALHMIPELLVLAIVATLASAALFAWMAKKEAKLVIVEPVAFLLATVAGFAVEYPSLLRHPLFTPLRPVPVLVAMAILVVLATVIARRARIVALVAALAWLVTLTPHFSAARESESDSVYLIGLDSLSQADVLPELRQTIASRRGTWYEHPVTPGLLTNSVWPALIQHRAVHETGVFLTYQRPDWNRSPYHLVREAKTRGFETWSFFSDQFTTYTGSIGGFDVDRSGPKGWLQLATATMKESHILAPVLLPRLPRIPLARTPRNQSGTYAFSLATELREIFGAGNGRKVFVAAHIDYLHQPAYPSMSEVTREERWRVRKAKVDAIWDLSLHWQYPELAGEPLGIYAWKIRHLQRLLEQAIEESNVADPNKQNRVILFSDHGNRKDVGIGDFAKKRYYKVLLATIGVPPRDPRTPISLLDIPDLLGWPDPSRPGPAPLVVEYTNVSGDTEWRLLMQSARLQRDGEVRLDPRVTSQFGQRLLAYAPHGGSREYVRVPAIPTEVTNAAGSGTKQPEPPLR